VPATIFVATAYVDSDRDFWWDELEHFLRAERRDRPRDHRALRTSLQRLGHDERRAELDRLWESIGATPPAPTGAPSSADVRAMANSDLLEVGAHTATHPRLTQLSAQARLEEIELGKASLERMIGRSVDHFSYPHGDHDDETAACVRRAGFAAACTTEPHSVTPRTDPIRIPRLSVENWPAAELGRRLDALLGGG
jgi:peptidoglycan/xylan/chitin deacetylase (PgdA/CDA1 family)